MSLMEPPNKVLTGRVNLREIGGVLREVVGRGLFEKHLRIADDRGERRAKFVADHREEAALGAVGFLGQLLLRSADGWPLRRARAAETRRPRPWRSVAPPGLRAGRSRGPSRALGPAAVHDADDVVPSVENRGHDNALHADETFAAARPRLAPRCRTCGFPVSGLSEDRVTERPAALGASGAWPARSPATPHRRASARCRCPGRCARPVLRRPSCRTVRGRSTSAPRRRFRANSRPLPAWPPPSAR